MPAVEGIRRLLQDERPYFIDLRLGPAFGGKAAAELYFQLFHDILFLFANGAVSGKPA